MTRRAIVVVAICSMVLQVTYPAVANAGDWSMADGHDETVTVSSGNGAGEQADAGSSAPLLGDCYPMPLSVLQRGDQGLGAWRGTLF